MKKITLLMTAIFAVTVSNAQLSIEFEEVPAGPVILVEGFDDSNVNEFTSIADQDGAAEPHTTTVEAFPVGTTGNSSTRALKFLVGAGNTFGYHLPLINILGTALNADNGNFITLKILSSPAAVAGGATSMNLGLKVGGAATVNYPFAYTPTSTTEWQTLVFDISGFTAGVTRLDLSFDQITRVNVIGEATWIDDIKQISTLSTDENIILAKRLDVYPNPTTGLLNISNARDYKLITIHNILGKTVKTFVAAESIDISDLSAGIYLLKTDTGITQKVVKK